jgi:molybdenum cofactor guanylyltransferase
MASRKLAPPPGFILAGGRSSRMGTNKALLTLGRDTIIGHVVRRLRPQVSQITINSALSWPEFPGLPRVEDRLAGQIGPLAGILTGMQHHAAQSPAATHFLSVPCDSPFLPLDLAPRLADGMGVGDLVGDNETIVIASSLGRRHPVFGLWPTALSADLEKWLAGDQNRRISAFLDRHRTVVVDFAPIASEAGELDPFLNINTPDDLSEASAFAELLA